MIAAAASRVSDLFGDSEPATAVELAAALDILRNERRRLIMREVARLDPSEAVEVRDLAHAVAAIEQDATPAALPLTDSKSAYVALLETHLQKLAAGDIVEVSENHRGSKTIARGPALEAFLAFLDDGEDYFVTDEGDGEC